MNDSIRDQFYYKAIECLKALREGCMKETESESFNEFLHKLKSDYEGKRRDDFWRMLAPNGLTLIHCDEVHCAIQSSSISLFTLFEGGRFECYSSRGNGLFGTPKLGQ